jgi:hypothetical protein
MWKVAAAVLVAAVLAVVLYQRRGDDRAAASVASAQAVLSCVQAAGLTASLERSSTGATQVNVTHGPGVISANTTLESSETLIGHLPSAGEASFFADQLRSGGGEIGVSPDLVSQHGNAVVVLGITATEAERATIDGCLA